MTLSSTVVVCAEPRFTGVNPGMLTVDLAWDVFRKRHGVPDDYRRVSVSSRGRVVRVSSGLELAYDSCMAPWLDEMTDDTRMVFWGDFLHAWHYHDADLRRLVDEGLPLEEIRSLARRVYLMEGASERRMGRSVSYGSTLVGDSAISMARNPVHRRLLERMMRSLGHVWMRDISSAVQVAHMRGDYSRSYLGTDCALLVGSRDYDVFLDCISCDSPGVEYVAVHFGRTATALSTLLSFARDLADALGLVPLWIPWLRGLRCETLQVGPGWRRRLGQVRGSSAGRDDQWFLDPMAGSEFSYSDVMRLLQGAALVVTDTYHMAIIAWRMGKAAVCLGAGSQQPARTVDDKKKELFYLMNNALPYYVYTEGLSSQATVRRAAQSVAQLVEEGDAVEAVVRNVRRQAEAADLALAAAIVSS